MSEYILDWYQWNYRPQHVKRPDWFKAWPGGARIAVTIKVMVEWESTPHVRSRSGMPSGAFYKEDYSALCIREYGFKSGIWRMLDIMDRQGVKMTAMTSGLAAEIWPEAVREVKKRGHEIATHQFDQAIIPPLFKSLEEERDSLLKSMDAIKRATGERPYGYMSPGPRPTPHTLDIIAQEGFVWNSDLHDADFPYIMDINGRKVVSLGYVRPGYTDNDLAEFGLSGGWQQLKDGFDAHYEEAAQQPMKFAYALHIHNTGPGQGKILEKFIEYVKKHEGVWFCRCIDMANFWLEKGGR